MAGTYTNGGPNKNFSEVFGIDAPDDAEVEFYSGSLSWQKVDASDTTKLLSGSEWTLTGPQKETVSEPNGGWPVGHVVDCDEESPNLCTGLDKDPEAGKFKVTDLPVGTYTLTETKAPDGYIADSEPSTAVISSDTKEAQFGDGGLISNSLGAATWTKTDGSEPLAGSEWELIRTEPTKQTYPVTDCVEGDESRCASSTDHDPRAGHFRVDNLPAGTYTLKETKAPQGYDELTEPVGPLVIDGQAKTIDFGDVANHQTKGQVTWSKVAEESNTTYLAGSTWTISGPGNDGSHEVTDCTSSPCGAGPFEDRDPTAGGFKLDGLDWGTYTLTETTPPLGYQKSSKPYTFTIGIDGDAKLVIQLGPIENKQQEVPDLPLTGGMSTDAFLLSGGGLLALAGLGGFIHRRRSLRVAKA